MFLLHLQETWLFNLFSFNIYNGNVKNKQFNKYLMGADNATEPFVCEFNSHLAGLFSKLFHLGIGTL